MGRPGSGAGGTATEPIGEESAEASPAAADLFDPATTGRVIVMQNVVPILATAGFYVTFRVLLAT